MAYVPTADQQKQLAIVKSRFENYGHTTRVVRRAIPVDKNNNEVPLDQRAWFLYPINTVDSDVLYFLSCLAHVYQIFDEGQDIWRKLSYVYPAACDRVNRKWIRQVWVRGYELLSKADKKTASAVVKDAYIPLFKDITPKDHDDGVKCVLAGVPSGCGYMTPTLNQAMDLVLSCMRNALAHAQFHAASNVDAATYFKECGHKAPPELAALPAGNYTVYLFNVVPYREGGPAVKKYKSIIQTRSSEIRYWLFDLLRDLLGSYAGDVFNY